MKSNGQLVKLINASPEPLRRYIMDLESFDGAYYVQKVFELEQQIESLSILLQKKELAPK